MKRSSLVHTNQSRSLKTTGDISSKTNTWPISNTVCQKWAQIERLGFWVPVHIESKTDGKNYSQHFIKHDEDNNSQLKTIFWNRIYKRSYFYIKTLDRFQDNVRFSIFEHILNLNHCRVFETNPIFPFLSIILNSEQNL